MCNTTLLTAAKNVTKKVSKRAKGIPIILGGSQLFAAATETWKAENSIENGHIRAVENLAALNLMCFVFCVF